MHRWSKTKVYRRALNAHCAKHQVHLDFVAGTIWRSPLHPCFNPFCLPGTVAPPNFPHPANPLLPPCPQFCPSFQQTSLHCLHLPTATDHFCKNPLRSRESVLTGLLLLVLLHRPALSSCQWDGRPNTGAGGLAS